MKKRKKQRSKHSRKFKRPQFIGLPDKPPTSIRYCLECKTMRTFRYNKFIGHSECVKCGSRKARREKPLPEI